MTLLDKTNTLITISAYNEQDSIVAVIEEVKATGFPFVVIDDGSTDETRTRVISAGARTISLPFNAGQQIAQTSDADAFRFGRKIKLR
jgi:glycosyltransferase involved in cell wall biosynthesis